MDRISPPPTLVLLPGMDGTGELFTPLVEAMGSHCPTVVVRYPGQHALGYAQLEAIARAALPADKPFVLLGESFSGPVAIALAASRPSRLKGLVLCCSFVSNPRRALSPLRHLLGLAPVGAMPVAVLEALLLGQFSNPPLRESLRKAMPMVSPSALRARMRSVLTVDVSAAFRSVHAPTLYLLATHDRVVPESASQRVLHLKPDTQVVRIDAPHCLLQAAPQEAAAALMTFMRQFT